MESPGCTQFPKLRCRIVGTGRGHRDHCPRRPLLEKDQVGIAESRYSRFPMGFEIKIAPDAVTLAHEAAQEFHRLAEAAVQQQGRFAVALSGGNTPRSVYSLLASEHKQLPWERIHIFFGDERHVSPDHPDSNFRMASESLLGKVPIPEKNVHRIRTELEADAAAQEYEQELREFFHLINHDWPRFDLIF